MEEPTPKNIFMASLLRCLKDEAFLITFYERFLASSDEVAEKFENTDFKKQRHMLAKSLKLVAGAMGGEFEALKELRLRAETHDRSHLNIRPELYGYWRAALIETAIQFDSKWDIQTHVVWDRALCDIIRRMTKDY